MNATELEEAACRPYQFQRIFESDNPFHHRSRVLDFSLPDDLPEETDLTDTIMNVEVLPGGRYIVTTSASGWLRCWDLVANRESSVLPFAILVDS